MKKNPSLALIRSSRGSHGCLSRCTRCGALNDTAACCLLAPEPKSWCAWCGEDLAGDVGTVKGKRVERQAFCGPSCSMSYHRDLSGIEA